MSNSEINHLATVDQVKCISNTNISLSSAELACSATHNECTSKFYFLLLVFKSIAITDAIVFKALCTGDLFKVYR